MLPWTDNWFPQYVYSTQILYDSMGQFRDFEFLLGLAKFCPLTLKLAISNIWSTSELERQKNQWQKAMITCLLLYHIWFSKLMISPQIKTLISTPSIMLAFLPELISHKISSLPDRQFFLSLLSFINASQD